MSVAIVHPVVAGLAECDQVPSRELILFVVFRREDVMNMRACGLLAISLAELALVSITAQDGAAQSVPLG